MSSSNNAFNQGPCCPNTQETPHFVCLSVTSSTEPRGRRGWRGCLQHEGAMSKAPSQKTKYESTHLSHSDQARAWRSARAQRCQAISAPNCHQDSSQEPSPSQSDWSHIPALPVSSLGLNFLICKMGINHHSLTNRLRRADERIRDLYIS